MLWVALAVNAAMFLAETAAGLIAGSVSLQADALDFLGDAFNYAISLAVVGLALTWRARAALVEGDALRGARWAERNVWHKVNSAWSARGFMPIKPDRDREVCLISSGIVLPPFLASSDSARSNLV